MLVQTSTDPARDQSATHWPLVETGQQFESEAEVAVPSQETRGKSPELRDRSRQASPDRGVDHHLIAFELANVDIVFSVKARRTGSDRLVGNENQGAGAPGTISPPSANVQCDNAVVEHLAHAISEAERSGEQQGLLCAKMLRLALETHRLSSRASNGTDTTSRQIAPLSKWRLKRAMQYIDAHLAESISLPDLAKVAGLSAMYFAAQFRVATGLRPHEFILRRRIDKAKDLLCDERNSLVDIALSVGFQTQSHFTTVFKRFANATPSQWRALQRAAA